MEVLYLILGIAIGIALTIFTLRKNRVGVLRVDESDPYAAPYLFAELTAPVSYIRKKKYVIMRVCDKNYLPAKNSTAIMDNPK